MRNSGECAFHIPLALRSQLQNALDGSSIVPASQAVQVAAKAGAENLQPQPKLRLREAGSARPASSTRRRMISRINSLSRSVAREILLRNVIRFATVKNSPTMSGDRRPA
jgi:hypothetical protein